MKDKDSKELVNTILKSYTDRFIALYGNETKLAEEYGLTKRQLTKLRTSHPGIQESHMIGLESLIDAAEANFIQGALEAKTGKNYYATIAMLKAWRRERYGDKQTIDVNNTGYARGAKEEETPPAQTLTLLKPTGSTGGYPQDG